jgi:hypothetical protein
MIKYVEGMLEDLAEKINSTDTARETSKRWPIQ